MRKHKMMWTVLGLLAAFLMTMAFVSAGEHGKGKLPAGHPGISGMKGGCPMMDEKAQGQAKAGSCPMMQSKSSNQPKASGCPMMTGKTQEDCANCDKHGTAGCPMMKGMKSAGKNVVRDQVCNMNIARSHAIKASYQGKPYFFCSASCKGKFTKNPSHYTKKITKTTGKA